MNILVGFILLYGYVCGHGLYQSVHLYMTAAVAKYDEAFEYVTLWIRERIFSVVLLREFTLVELWK